jgi:2-polyprenyl-3-methyl-5-hydroxy-6-metoxy-1,4-benzoquinol methylase
MLTKEMENGMSVPDVTQAVCRFCGTRLRHTFVDLGMSPLAESWLKPSQLNQMERFYPLHVYVCEHCFLVQLEEFESPDHIFTEYAYFSSYSETWLQHAKSYVDMTIERFGLNGQSQVVEIASNDGYLLRNFIGKGTKVLGIEPAANVAKVAIERGIPTLVKFFGEETARQLVSERTQADLIVGNNVLPHVPNLNDFVKGMKILLKPEGTITM